MQKRDIYKKRDLPWPPMYPEAIELMESLQRAFWLESQVPFSADVQEIDGMPFHMKEGVLRNLLCVATIEVAIKTFWPQLGSHFPHHEWDMVGIEAGEAESRHFMSYNKILRLTNLEDRFAEVAKIPAIKKRYEYLDKYLKLSPNNSDPRKYIIKLILFSCLMEHTSLFGQFVPLVYYFKKFGQLKDIKNIVKWTATDEMLHFKVGGTLVNILREEHPEYFDEELTAMIKKACTKSIKYEKDILDWVWENGELEGLSKENILSFMKEQVNFSLKYMGFDPCFEDVGDLKPTDFFKRELFGDSYDDFFAVRPADYTMGGVAFTPDQLGLENLDLENL